MGKYKRDTKIFIISVGTSARNVRGVTFEGPWERITCTVRLTNTGKQDGSDQETVMRGGCNGEFPLHITLP